jgi:hypothetical protein
MIRKNFTALTGSEVNALGAAFNYLWDINYIQNNTVIHNINFNTGIHWGPDFLPWHRDFLRKLELEMQNFDPSVNLPYWDWTKNNSRNLEIEPWLSFLGGRANSGGMFDHWDYQRNNSSGPFPLPTLSKIITELEANSFLNYRKIEGFNDGILGSHVPGHTWVGGSMATGRSPADPIFYLHHCNIDRLWSVWQLNNPDIIQYEHTGSIDSDRVEQARVPIDSPMIGGATPRSMLDHAQLGYTYAQDTILERIWKEKNRTFLVTHQEGLAQLHAPLHRRSMKPNHLGSRLA